MNPPTSCLLPRDPKRRALTRLLCSLFVLYSQSCSLVGAFNDWEPKENHWAVRNDFGVFSLFLPDIDGVPQIQQNTKVRAVALLGLSCSRVLSWH